MSLHHKPLKIIFFFPQQKRCVSFSFCSLRHLFLVISHSQSGLGVLLMCPGGLTFLTFWGGLWRALWTAQVEKRFNSESFFFLPRDELQHSGLETTIMEQKLALTVSDTWEYMILLTVITLTLPRNSKSGGKSVWQVSSKWNLGLVI